MMDIKDCDEEPTALVLWNSALDDGKYGYISRGLPSGQVI